MIELPAFWNGGTVVNSLCCPIHECQPMKKPDPQIYWREFLIDGYALAGCVILFAYLIWRWLA